MCVCVCVCMYAYIYIIYVHVHIYVYVYIYIHIYAYVNTYGAQLTATPTRRFTTAPAAAIPRALKDAGVADLSSVDFFVSRPLHHIAITNIVWCMA